MDTYRKNWKFKKAEIRLDWPWNPQVPRLALIHMSTARDWIVTGVVWEESGMLCVERAIGIIRYDRDSIGGIAQSPDNCSNMARIGRYQTYASGRVGIAQLNAETWGPVIFGDQPLGSRNE